MRQTIRNILFAIVIVITLFVFLKFLFIGRGSEGIAFGAITGILLGLAVNALIKPLPNDPPRPHLGDWLRRLWKSEKWGKVALVGTGIATALVALPSEPKSEPLPLVSASASTPQQVVSNQPTPTITPTAIRVTPQKSPTPVTPTITPRPTKKPLPTDTPGPSPTPTPNREIILGSTVNLRQGPNTAFKSVASLPAESRIILRSIIVFEGERWYEVGALGTGWAGWVSSSVVPVDEQLVATLPTSTEKFILPTPLPEPTAEPQAPAAGNCSPSYPDVCIPSGPDLDCGDIPYRRFRVVGSDPHKFDRDNDGIGCES